MDYQSTDSDIGRMISLFCGVEDVMTMENLLPLDLACGVT